MLNKILKAGLLTAAVLVAFPHRAATANVSVSVDIGVFHDRLAPYGEWISVPRYGTCWRPRHVVRTWRPYTAGYWVYTDYGWTWVSYENWGWATYHYGRWFSDPSYGWVWVPGPTWAPAYVTWRSSNDWIGWAPLPPGIAPGVSVRVDIGPSSYTFVRTRHFLDRQLSGHFAPVSRNAVLLGSTRNVTRYDVQGSRIIDRGVDPRQIERVSGHRVAQLRVRNAMTATRGRVANNALSVYRPVAGRGGRRISPSSAPHHAAAPPPGHGTPRASVTRRDRRPPSARAQAAPSSHRQRARPPRQERATTGQVPRGPRGGGAGAPHGRRGGGPHGGAAGKAQKEGGGKHEKG